MRTSRLEGMLILETKKPYKIATDGNLTEQTQIVCKDIDSVSEAIAFDIEQMYMVALMDIQNQRAKNSDQKQIESNEKNESENKDFYENECPSSQDVEKYGSQLMMLFKMNSAIAYSKLLGLFNELLSSGRICAIGGAPMTQPIWASVDRKDKERIVFAYISFFVNPLLSLENLSSETDKNAEQEVKEEEPTLFE